MPATSPATLPVAAPVTPAPLPTTPPARGARIVPALAAASASSPLTRTTVERRAVGERDVRIDIAYVGICHTDIHMTRDDWGGGIFPMVPGHEITGVVAEVGAGVGGFAVGDRVGVGCFVDSCRTCARCAAGEQQYCAEGSTDTYNALDRTGEPTYGGYSTCIVVDHAYVLRIPDGLGLAEAAPLLCAGITVWSPLRRWGAGPGRRVAVVGMGGLGHMAVKFAAALGAEVTVLSQTLAKRGDAEGFGAAHCFATGDPATFEALANGFDLIVNTVSAQVDLNAYASLLDVDGTLVLLGAPPEPMPLHVFSLLFARRRIVGSMVGGIPETQEMLDFAAAHGLGAETETVSADEVNEAYERVLRSEVRYRYVIDVSTI